MSWTRCYRSRSSFYRGEDDASEGAPRETLAAITAGAGATSEAPAVDDDRERSQLIFARRAAETLIEAGAVGDGEIVVTLNGHIGADSRAHVSVTVVEHPPFVAPATPPALEASIAEAPIAEAPAPRKAAKRKAVKRSGTKRGGRS